MPIEGTQLEHPSISGLPAATLPEEPGRHEHPQREAEQNTPPTTVARAVQGLRAVLEMDVAFVGRFSPDGYEIFSVLQGDGSSFGLHEGYKLPLDETYCKRVIAGRLPNMVVDAAGDERAASLSITEQADIGAFVSIPLRFSNSELYGTLCAASHRPRPDLGYRELRVLRVFADMVSDELEREHMRQKTHQNELQDAAIDTLIAVLDARDSYTGEHSQVVVSHAAAVAHKLGLSEHEMIDVKRVALLHDLGKILIPDTILHKQGPLSEPEWEVMRTHPIRSAELLDAVPTLIHLAPAVRAEHERWDGRGYPDGLAGTQIPLASRITFVCDAYHAMTSDRPYREAMSAPAALAEIVAGRDSQFCPTVVDAFLATGPVDL